MATARKLPSGSWRCRVYTGKDAAGKNMYKSFTARTKREAELKATQYLNSPELQKHKNTVTVSDALERYITAKAGVLSPSSIRGYRQMQRRYYGSIGNADVYRLTTEDLQRFVSSIAGTVSAKTVSNVYGLLSSAVGMFRPDASFRVSLPKKVRQKRSSPTNRDIISLFGSADGDLKVCIALAAFGSLRRGEICALQYGDLDGCVLYVHADMVKNSENKFVYKEIPKTSDSVRRVVLPEMVVQLLGSGAPDEFIIKKTPNAVTSAFMKLRNRLGLGIRFHDLRHYYASIGAVLGVPDTYMSDFGGWRRGSGVLKEVYQDVMEDAGMEYRQKMNDHFSSLIGS